MVFSIGTVKIDAPVFLAPMTGVTDLPFRRLVKRYGAGLVFSEMIASRRMLEQYHREKKPRTSYTEEFPMSVQLAGCDPEIIAEAAKVNEAHGAAIIDLNFGCPVKKVVNNFAGSALMKDEKLSAQIMEAAVKAVTIPVTVKMRLGWDGSSINAPRLAKIAEEIGVKMITVHGRTRNQLYNGAADWRAIAAVKESVSIPVIANGDIVDAQSARAALAQSGADGVMIGRGSYGRPWIIRRIIDAFETGKESPAPDLAEISSLILDHYDSLIEHYGPCGGVGIARKHIGWYCKDMPGSDEVRARINEMTDSVQVRQALKDYFDALLNQEPIPILDRLSRTT